MESAGGNDSNGSERLTPATAIRAVCLQRLENAVRDASDRGDMLASKIKAATPDQMVENLIVYFEAAAPATVPNRAPASPYHLQASTDKPTDYLAAIYGNPGSQDNDPGSS